MKKSRWKRQPKLWQHKKPAEAVEETNEAQENTEKSTPVVPIVIGVLVVAAAGGAVVAVSKEKVTEIRYKNK